MAVIAVLVLQCVMNAITTEEEFLAEMNRMSSEISQCMTLFYQYIEINNYAAEKREIFDALNNNGEFWNVNNYALQQTMFISLGRIFDSGKDTHSIYKLLKAARVNRQFFSKSALLARRMKNLAKKPDFMDEFIAAAHEPTEHELHMIKDSLKAAGAKYTAVYGNIRNQHIGHTIVRDRPAIDLMYGKVVLAETREVFYALADAMFVLRQLWDNGRKPVMGKLKLTTPERVAKQTRAALDGLKIRRAKR